MAEVVIGVIGAVIGAASAVNQANAAKDTKRKAAAAAAAKAEAEAKRQRQATETLVSRQRALYAASGATLEGSPLEVMDITLDEAAAEREQIRMLGGLSSDIYHDAGNAAYSQGMGNAAGFLFSGAETLLGGLQDSPSKSSKSSNSF